MKSSASTHFFSTTSKKFIYFLCAVSYCFSSFAQDANYWSSSYGPGGYFAPGSVIANNSDSGVLYYNPALLTNNTKTAASITGTIYELQYIKIKNGVGTGLDLKSGNTAIIPLIASHTIPFLDKKLPFTLVYGITTSPTMNYIASQRKDGYQNVLGDNYSPGDEVFVGQFSEQRRSSETSVLIGSGFKLNSKLSGGLMMEVNFHKQSYLQNFTSRSVWNIASNSDTIFPPMSSILQYYELNYWNAGLRFKGGLSYNPTSKDHIGLVVTSPMIGIYGQGTVVAEGVVANMNISGITYNLLASTRQTKIKSKWKMPLSVGLGYCRDFEKMQLYFATEYFSKVDEYDVVRPAPSYFIRSDTVGQGSSSDIIKLKDARNSVLNFALGMSFKLSNSFRFYTSLRTDFSYAKTSAEYSNELGAVASFSIWNIYHGQFGVNMQRKKFSLRAGLLLAYGISDQYKQPINYTTAKDSNFLMGEPGNTDASYINASFLISYIHNF